MLIPARGGSVGVPRKNLRLLAGKPLIAYAISAALKAIDAACVIVITDDDEIERVARQAGAEVILESMATPPEETLDTKVLRNLPALRERGAGECDVVLTIQPTSPLITPESIQGAIEAFDSADVRSALTVADDRHLRWARNSSGEVRPAYSERVNRQYLPETYRETGGIIGARLGDIERFGTRVIAPTEVIVLGDDEAIDIDTFSDFYVAAHLVTRKRIAIRVDAAPDLGMGHVYRALALATETARHQVKIFVSEDRPLGREFFNRTPFAVQTVRDEQDFLAEMRAFEPHLIVFDILDTEESSMRAVRAAVPEARIVTFEDRGSGAAIADLHVAEFITNLEVEAERQLEGIRFSLLSPAFEIAGPVPTLRGKEAFEILLLFGGTDPSGLAAKALESLARIGYDGHVTVVRGMGASPLPDLPTPPFDMEVLQDVKNMPDIMARADFALTSAGRTIIELCTVGIPSLCLVQNAKELTHNHAIAANGVEPLGLGAEVQDAELDEALRRFLDDDEYRQRMKERAQRVGRQRSNHRTIAAIFDRIGFDPFPEI